METMWTLSQTSKPLSGLQPRFASHQKQKEGKWKPSDYHVIVQNSGVRRRCVLYCGRRDEEQQHLILAIPNYSNMVHENNSSVSCCSSSSRGKTRRGLTCSVLNESGPTSQEAPSAEELKDQLEALEEEALRVRDRYNNSRARFMRLTEVAEHLRQRAAIDMKLRDEDSARKMLIEKKKVMQAAELSKKRAHILEELSNKLGEAISWKETQLLIALSSPQLRVSSNEEPTVRVISPKGPPLSSIDLDLDIEETPTGINIPGPPQSGPDVPDSADAIRLQTVSDETEVMIQEVKGCSREVTSDSRVQVDNKSFSAYGGLVKEEDNEDFPPGRKEVICNRLDSSLLQAGESLLFETYLQGVDLTSGLDRGVEGSPGTARTDAAPAVDDFHNFKTDVVEEEVDVTSRDIDSQSTNLPVNNEGQGASWNISPETENPLPGTQETVEASKEVNFFDVTSLSFGNYILDVDHQIAAVESKLRIFLATAVNEEQDKGDGRLQLVGQLLDQVRSLRARISDAVLELPPQEVQ